MILVDCLCYIDLCPTMYTQRGSGHLRQQLNPVTRGPFSFLPVVMLRRCHSKVALQPAPTQTFSQRLHYRLHRPWSS
jgi:hypothetical protein